MIKTKLDELYEDIPIEDPFNMLLIDFHNLCYRCLHVAFSEFKDKKNKYLMGENNLLDNKDDDKWFKVDMFIYWKHLVLQSMFYSIADKKPNRVIVAIDGRDNWRKSVFALYKFNRKSDRERSEIDFEIFYNVMNDFINNLESMFSNIYFIQVDKSEADDVIAALVKDLSKDKNNKIELISTDKDFMQLQKYKNFMQYDPIKKKYLKSINPMKELEIKILTGDKSDNIDPIMRGVGPKTAEKLLNGGIFKKKSLDEYYNDKEIKDKFIRNRTLIDFKYIPEEINDSILKQYNEYKLGEFIVYDVYEWLLEQDLNRLADELDSFCGLFCELG